MIQDGKNITFKQLLELDNSDKDKAISKVVPNIIDKQQEIIDFINSIPNKLDGIEIINEEIKQYYITGIKLRLNKLLLPIYKK